MKVRILLDEDIHKRAAEHLRRRGFDAIHVDEADRAGLEDLDQLLFARSVSRVLVTFNVKDFVRIHRQYLEEGREHHGIIVSKQVAVGELIKQLAALIDQHPPEYFANGLFFL